MPGRSPERAVIDDLTHWSLVALFVLLFVAGLVGAAYNWRVERRRSRRYVRRVR
jgi:hypothetical protein